MIIIKEVIDRAQRISARTSADVSENEIIKKAIHELQTERGYFL